MSIPVDSCILVKRDHSFQRRKSMIQRERIDEIQSMRGLAFSAVVLQHALGMFLRLPGVNVADLAVLSLIFNLAKFAVPMFVFITGLVIFYNYYEKISYPSYIWKRFKEILVPYAVFTPFYYLYWDWQANEHTVNELWKVFLTGSGYWHLWFVAMIFQFYLLFPLFRIVFRRLAPIVNTERKVVSALLLTLVVYIVCVWYFTHHKWAVDIIGIRGMFGSYLDRNFLMWFFYFVFGGVLAFAIVRFRERLVRIQFWNVPFFVVMLSWVTYEVSKTITMTPKPFVALGVSTSLKTSMILFTVSSILVIYSMSVSLAKRNNSVTKFFNLLGQYSYGGYLLHAFWLDIFYKIVHKQLAASMNNTLMMAITTLIVIVVSLLSAMLIARIPFLGPLLVGSSGRKKKKKQDVVPQQTTTA